MGAKRMAGRLRYENNRKTIYLVVSARQLTTDFSSVFL